MKFAPNAILSRIERCRLQRKWALTWDEEGAWEAEEAGLIDALFGRDRTEIRKKRHPNQFRAYVLGLRDGKDLMRLFKLKNERQPGRAESKAVGGLDQVPSWQLADSS